MPLIRISLRAGKPADYRRAIAENVYESLRETFNVPENDFFATSMSSSHATASMTANTSTSSAPTISCSFNSSVSNIRTVEQKKALYRRIVERLAKNPGLRAQDIFLNLLEVAKENWSFGNGEAQYA
jgi:4-oxalocrotonate tautomerase